MLYKANSMPTTYPLKHSEKLSEKKNGIVYNRLFTCFLTPAFSFLIVFARRRLLIVLGAMGILGRVIAGHTPSPQMATRLLQLQLDAAGFLIFG